MRRPLIPTRQDDRTAVVLRMIAVERKHQIEKHGWSPDHDDTHDDGDLAWAAICYAAPGPVFKRNVYANGVTFCDPWPWHEGDDRRPADGSVILNPDAYSPKVRRKLLVKAAALIVAEIERLDRASAAKVV